LDHERLVDVLLPLSVYRYHHSFLDTILKIYTIIFSDGIYAYSISRKEHESTLNCI